MGDLDHSSHADDGHAGHLQAFQLTGAEYEVLVANLVRALTASVSRLAHVEIHAGSTNRLPGASGYSHQIDLSMHDQAQARLFIVEAKCWKEVVGVDALLTLASRQADIQAHHPELKVHASIVSTRPVSRGAAKLAKHFGIGTDTVASEAEFGLTFADQHFVSLVERVHVKDEVSAELWRPCSACGKQFAAQTTDRHCAACSADVPAQ